RGLVAAAGAPDGVGRVLAAGLTEEIFTQAAIHIAVNVQLVPATGIPLPFVSQGGSSLLAMALAAGLIASVAAREQPSSREQWTAERWRR
ncbi:MAG: cell division protein FtsW, partial [Chloroflexi bacterium]|nr:cell division protein FtsW [Chloroflexota bacterium]